MSRFHLRARGRSPTGLFEAVSLMNADGLRRIVENPVANFVGFVPLGTVLVAMVGVGVAERAAAGSGSCSTAVVPGTKRICTLPIHWMGGVQSSGARAAVGRQR